MNVLEDGGRFIANNGEHVPNSSCNAATCSRSRPDARNESKVETAGTKTTTLELPDRSSLRHVSSLGLVGRPDEIENIPSVFTNYPCDRPGPWSIKLKKKHGRLA